MLLLLSKGPRLATRALRRSPVHPAITIYESQALIPQKLQEVQFYKIVDFVIVKRDRYVQL